MHCTVPQKKSKKWYEKVFPLRRKSYQRRGREKKRKIDTCIRLVIKPLRIFQFLVVLLIFVLIIYTIMLDDFKLSSVMCILLIVLSGVYLFVLSIDLINQFIGEDVHTVPMFIFSFLGTLFFGAAGIFLLAAHAFNAPWYVLTIACALILTWILFIIDILLIMVFWKRSCNSCKPCCYPKETEISHQQNICHPICSQTVKCDLMTSVSSVKVPSGDENAVPDHSSRKIGYGRRRQYVDCPTSARALCFADAADVQTEQQETSDAHCQAEQEMRETPVQTVSKCELCNRQIQIFYNSAASPQTATPQACAPCPALVQLLSGSGCCPGCRCVTGIIQVSQQSQQQQTQRMKPSKEDKVPTKEQRWPQSKDKKSNELLTSKGCQLQDPKVTGTITKLTLASYCMSPKKTTVSCQTNTSEPVKQTSGSAKRNSEDLSSGKTRANLEKEKLDAKKKADNSVQDKERDRANSILKKGPRSSIKRSSESSAEKPLEASKKITSESSTKKQEASSKMEETVAEKPMESSKKETAENSARKSVESSVKEVANSVRKNETQEVEEGKKSFDANNEKSNTTGQRRFSSPKAGHRLSQNKAGEGSTSDSKNFASKENAGNRRRSSNVRADASVGKLRNLSTDSEASISSNHGGIEDEGQEMSVENDKAKDKKNLKEKRSDSKDGKNRTKRKKSDSKTKSEDEAEHRATNLRPPGTKMEKSLETDAIHKPDAGTQTTAKERISRSKRTYGLWRRNKIEPTEYSDMDIQTVGDSDAKPSTSKQSEALCVKDSSLTDGGGENICPACKKLQEPTAPLNSQQYYNIHKDHRGRVFCEYCATPNTVKILFKREDQKRLKCAGCGQFIRVKSGQNVRNKSDSCPHCGQGQSSVQSAVST